MIENITKKNNFIFTIAVILFNLTIFTDFLPYNTIIKFIALVLIVMQLLINKKPKLYINTLMTPMLVYLIFVVLNISVGGDISFISTFAINILIMVLLMQFKSFSKLEVKIIKIVCIIHLIFAIIVKIAPESFVNQIFSKIIGSGYNINYSWRVIQGVDVGITKQPGVLAMYMVVLSAFFFAKIVKEEKKGKYLIGYTLSTIIILLTAKRSAIVFSITTIMILLILYNNKKITSKKIFKGACLACMTLILFMFINSNFDIFSNIQNKNQELTSNSDVTNGRNLIWEKALSLFWQNPVFGMGLKYYYNLTGLDVHNTYIQCLLEMGIVGFIVFLICIGKISIDCLKKCKKNYKNGFKDMEISTIIGLYLIVFLILYGFVGNTFIDYLPLSLFIIAISMISNDYFFQERG